MKSYEPPKEKEKSRHTNTHYWLRGLLLLANELIHLSLQSGCCKPPTACEYTYVNPVLWVNPANPMDNPDCYMWNNDQIQLCYNCNACKAGLLGNLRREWRKANMVLLVALAILIWVYIFACCAYKNARRESLFRHYKQGWFWLLLMLCLFLCSFTFGPVRFWCVWFGSPEILKV